MRVTGRLKSGNGIPVGFIDVAAFDNDLRSRQLLGGTRTASDGRYSIDYEREQFGRAEKRSADVFIEVRAPGSDRVQRSPVFYNAPDVLVIDLVLDDDFFPGAEFTRLRADVQSLAADANVEIAALDDSDEHQDVDFLAAELGLPAERIVQLIVAHRIERAVHITPEFFYALFRVEALSDFSVERLHAVRFVLTVDVDPWAILDEVTLLAEDAIRAAVDEAIEQRYVEPGLPEALPGILRQLATRRGAAAESDATRARTALADLVGRTLDGGGIAAVAEVLAEDHLGDVPRLLARVQGALAKRSDAASEETCALLELSRFLGVNGSLIDGVKAHLGVTNGEDVRALAGLNREAWNATLHSAAEAGAFGPRVPSGEALEREAGRLADQFATNHPTAAFLLRMAKTDEALSDGEALTRIAHTHPELDLGTLNVERFMADHDISATAEVKAALKATQRLFKLAPSDVHAAALAKEDLRSAQAVARLSREDAVARLTRHPGVTEEAATRIHARAERIHAGAVLLSGELKSLVGSLDADALAPAVSAAKLASWKADFPSLKSLFEVQDLCECRDCRSVLGPAAYLADSLQFLKDRKVKDATNLAAPASKIAKDALFERRPDLGDIDLDCDNALTAIPYIDVVNELLEELVAPDPGVAFGGAVAAGAPPAALVQLIATQSWALGDRSTVTGPDLTGNFWLRGTAGTYKLVPDGAGGFTVFRTRQTHGTAAERAAAPEYRNEAAYQTLATERIAFALPFDAPQRELDALFARFDVRRADLMRDLAKGGVPSVLGIASAEIGISRRVAVLIVTADPKHQDEFWNTASGQAVPTFKVVSAFLDRTGMTYAELEEILRQPFVDPTGVLFIRHLDASCDTAQKEIAGLDADALDRLHRFVRLWRVSGLTLAQVNAAIRYDVAGAGLLDDAAFIRLADVFRLARRTGKAVADLLLVYGPGKDAWPPALYRGIFANPANGPAGQITAEAVAANEALAPGTGVQLATLTKPIAVALARTPAEIDALRALLATDDLTFANLATLHGHSAVARLAALKIASYLALRRQTASDPIASPSATWDFLDVAEVLDGAGVDPLAVERLLSVSAVDPDARIPTDAAVQTLLEKLQTALAAAHSGTRPTFDGTLTPGENTPPMLDLVARLGELDAAALARLEQLARGRWNDPNETPTQFLDRVFVAVLLPAALLVVKAAWGAVPGGDPDTKTTERNAFIAAVNTGTAEILYERARHAAAIRAVNEGMKLDAEIAGLLLERAHLKAVPAVAAEPLGTVVTDPALIVPNLAGQLPTPTPAAFPNAFAAVKLIGVMTIAIGLLRLERRHVAWLFDQPAAVGVVELDRLPYAPAMAGPTFAAVLRSLRARRLDTRFAPTDDPQAPGTLVSLLDVMAFASNAAATAASLLARLATVTAWRLGDVTALDGHFGFTAANVASYADPVTIERVGRAMDRLRQLGVAAADGVALSQDLVSVADVAFGRAALRVRYEPADWLAVQKDIEDGLREQRRDALIAYLTATDARFTSAIDLFEYLLTTVDMCSCQPTSRIVQAHGTLQLFVERCLLGLEPATVADTAEDSGWARWSWMRNYRVWEANRRVFLYPENWIEPELRDDKSPFFLELENELAQTELTDRAAEDATQHYLEKLDEVAFLEHLACYYESAAGTLHVFARTKGGDPSSYYYRRFYKEREWTPWEPVDLDIAADHLVAFVRNGRLYLAWPLFEEEAEQEDQEIPVSGGGTAPAPAKRFKIKIAISEYSHGKWLPKKLSKEGLAEGAYTRERLDSSQYRFTAMDFAGAGFCIVVTEQGDPGFNGNAAYDRYFGAFSITGCKGYPEPVKSSHARLVFRFMPFVKDAVVRANRPREVGSDATNDFALIQLPLLQRVHGLFRNTPDGNTTTPSTAKSGPSSATFKVAYPYQTTSLDQLLNLVILLLLSRRPGFSIEGRSLELPTALGTLLPFFFEDHNRVYSIVPAFADDGGDGIDRVPGDTPPVLQTASDFLPIFDDLWERVRDAYDRTIARGAPPDALLHVLEDDPEFQLDIRKLQRMRRLRFGYRVDNAFHPLVCTFRRVLNEHGLPGLLNRELQLRTTGFQFAPPQAYWPGPLVLQPYPVEDVDFRKEGAYAGYNWELFFHLPFLMAVKLSKAQRFEEAMRWFHFIFDPTGTQGGTAPQKYWITAPFFRRLAPDYVAQRIDTILYQVAQDPSGGSLGSLADQIEDWRDRPFRPHVIARARSVAYQKAILMKYVDNLIAWGDASFRLAETQPEFVIRADQLYRLAEKLLGPKPRLIPPVVEPRPATFSELEEKLDLFSNALLELENLVPDPGALPEGGAELPPTPASLTSLYFCIPPNDKMLEYWNTIADRRFNLTHCKTLDGADRSLALFAPRIDPADLVRATAQGLSIGTVLAGLGAPVPPYRFTVIAQRAAELIQEVRTLGQQLEQALEKRDGEDLALLRGTLELELLDKITEMKEAQIEEAVAQIKALELSIASVQTRLAYYRSRQMINELETVALVLQGLSGVSQGVASALQAAAGVVNLLPNVNIGLTGFGGSPTVTVTWGSANVAGGLSSFAGAAGSLAAVFGTAGSMVGTVAGYQRRKEEWDFQGNVADKEIAQLQQQVTVAKIRETVTRKDLASHKKQIHNAERTDEFMRSKFTNRDLFDWMAGEIGAIYFQAYDLAFAMAKRAERCFQHELGTTDTFVQYGSWDGLRKGLGAADRLMHQVRRMESSYYERNRRDYELVTHVSLAMLDPVALLQLKQEGECTITVPEALFDLEHSGHYFRRLKAVSLSVPCVAGPFTSVACRLTLLSNRYRRTANATTAAQYQEDPGQDPAFVYNVGGIQSIATSQGQNDTGMFELSFRDDRYLPFEGCGAIATWNLQLGSSFRTFDPSTIADVVLRLQYTARQGGALFKKAVDDSLADHLAAIENAVKKSGLLRAVDLRRDHPDAWARLKDTRSSQFTITTDMLPYFAASQNASLSDAWLLARVHGQPGSFAFTVDGTPLTASKDILVDGLCSTSLPLPLGIALDTPFTFASAKAADLEDAYLVVRYELP